MSRPRSDDNSVLLVHAYLDGELDPANALSVGQQMSQEPALAAEAEHVRELQNLIHDGASLARDRDSCRVFFLRYLR